MGYQPGTPYYEMYEKSQKEVEQLQIANNELTAELHRLQQDERLGITDVEQLARDRETAEDYLWHSQQKLQMEKAYTKGFASVSLISLPASIAFALGVAASDHLALVVVLAIFAAVFGIIALVGFGVVFAKVFGMLPETRQLVAKNQRDLDRAALKELGL